MIKFRWHRGNLADSMATVREFRDRSQLEKYVKMELAQWGIGEFMFLYRYTGYDSRVNWKTWYVLVNGKCVGMADFGLMKKASVC